MTIDVDALAKQMFGAAFPILKGRAPSIAGYVQGECKKIADTFATIEAECAAGNISEPEAKILFDTQKGSMRSVLLLAEGLGALAAEEAINAALAVVRPIVNASLGFLLF